MSQLNPDGTVTDWIVQLTGSNGQQVTVTNNRLDVNIDGTVFFVDGASGSDTNNGTQASPLKTIQAAINKSGSAVAITKPGIYREQLTINKPFTILNAMTSSGTFGNLATDSLTHMVDIRSSDRSTITWNAYNTPTYKSAAPFSAYTPRAIFVESIVDSNKLFSLLAMKSSIAEVEATAGSWYRDGSNYIYIHMPDNSNPNSATLEINKAGNACNIATNCSYANFRGVAFSFGEKYGCFIDQNGTLTPNEFIFEQCVARYNRTEFNASGMGFGTNGYMLTKFFGCRAYGNRFDGYNFHFGGHHELHNSDAYYNGDDGASPHEDAYLLVRGGHFYGNGKAGLAAVTGAKMVVEHARCTGNAQFGIFYSDTGTKGRIFRSLIANNATGLSISSAQVSVDTLTSTGNTTAESITSGGEKWVIV